MCCSSRYFRANYRADWVESDTCAIVFQLCLPRWILQKLSVIPKGSQGPSKPSACVRSPNENENQRSVKGVLTRPLSFPIFLLHLFWLFFFPLNPKLLLSYGRVWNLVVVTKISPRRSNQWKTSKVPTIYSLLKVVYAIQLITSKYSKNRYRNQIFG